MHDSEALTADRPLYIRPDAPFTMSELADKIGKSGEEHLVRASDMQVDFLESLVSFRPSSGGDIIESPLTGSFSKMVANYCGVPEPFFARMAPDVRQYLVNRLLPQQGDSLVVEVDDDAIVEVRSSTLEKIDPSRLIETAINVVGEDAQVLEGYRTSAEVRFDVVVADGAPRGIGGDFKVNDVTKGGLRFGQNLKSRLAPWVESIMYRLICTNGMEVPNRSQKVTLKGNTIDDVMIELEIAARAAFDSVEADIATLYDLRSHRVGSAEQMILRVGEENGVASSILTDAVRAVPLQVTDPDDATMFDVVAVLTNMGNHPDILGRPERRRKLELSGGKVVSEHSARCGTCQSILL